MPALQHIYMTAHGQWTAAPWSEERAQMGVRLAIVDDTDVPTPGTPFTIPADNGDVVAETGTQAGANGILSKAFTARMGQAGSTFNMDAGRQIDLAEDFFAFLGAISGWGHSSFRWTHVKIAPILATGKYAYTGGATYDFTAPIVGVNVQTGLPPEVAVCASLRAPISGRTGRGRMYVPGLASTTLATNGTVMPAFRTVLADEAAAFIAALDDAPGLDESGTIVMVTSAGKATGVRPSQVRVGDHFDAQRRRQHQAVETYTDVAL